MKAKDLAALLLEYPEHDVVFSGSSEYMYSVGEPKPTVLRNSDDRYRVEVLVLGTEVPTTEYTVR